MNKWVYTGQVYNQWILFFPHSKNHSTMVLIARLEENKKN
jgi:hypothetical protein